MIILCWGFCEFIFESVSEPHPVSLSLLRRGIFYLPLQGEGLGVRSFCISTNDFKNSDPHKYLINTAKQKITILLIF